MKASFSDDPKKRFVNPYNFIPLTGKCERSESKETESQRYTGYFNCRIKLLTPLFIPNTSSSQRLLTECEKQDEKCEKEKWKGYDFFSYDDWSEESPEVTWPPAPPANPVIPGSELRGAIRSVYEAAFKGCLSSVSGNRALSRRTAEAKKPGILKMEKEKGQWLIYPCERAMLFVETPKIRLSQKHMGVLVPKKEYDQWKEGQELWIKRSKTPYEKKNNQGELMIMPKVVEAYKVIEDSNIAHTNDKKNAIRAKLEKSGYVKGWLHRGEDFKQKHHESVFYNSPQSKIKPIRVNHLSDITNLEKTLKEYRDPVKNRMCEKKDNWYSGYEIEEKGTLVYYCKTKDDHVILSPACIGRESFTKTVEELLKNRGGYAPCTDNHLCPACRIFGMVGKEGERGTYAYGSKVRVTDAQLIQQVTDSRALFDDPIILPELGEPKPGAVEFYTKPPYSASEKLYGGKGYWTYDYKHKIIQGKITKEFLNLAQPELRGRKYYWHSSVDLKQYKDGKDNKVTAMKQRIRPMKAGVPNAKAKDVKPLFSFRVYFEGLSQQELTRLKWALDFGNPRCAHKIGRGKPLGFGSAQFLVDTLNLRIIDAATGAWVIKTLNPSEFLSQHIKTDEAVQALQLMADWEGRPENVRYPLVEMEKGGTSDKKNSAASHQWFKENKGKISKPNFLKVLPDAKDDAKKDLEPEKALFTLIKKQ